MQKLFQKICDVIQQGQKVALTAVISSTGSVPASTRAKMLVFQDGSIMGTVGGGQVEANIIQYARQILMKTTPAVIKAELTAEQAEAEGAVCGGTVDVFIEPVSFESDMIVIQEVIRTYAESRTAVVATLLNAKTCRKILVRDDRTWVGTFGHEVVDRMIVERASPHLGQSYLETVTLDLPQEQLRAIGIEELHTYGKVCFETIIPFPTAYIFGGGHIALHLSKILPMIGFEYVVIDDRQEFVSRKRFPEARERVHHEFPNVLQEFSFIPHASYLILVTRGHKADLIVLEQAIQRDVKYIGMIGSKRKIAVLFQHLQERGVTQETLHNVHAPIGLEIGADTPEEIAVSIAAELIKVRRKKES